MLSIGVSANDGEWSALAPLETHETYGENFLEWNFEGEGKLGSTSLWPSSYSCKGEAKQYWYAHFGSGAAVGAVNSSMITKDPAENGTHGNVLMLHHTANSWADQFFVQIHDFEAFPFSDKKGTYTMVFDYYSAAPNMVIEPRVLGNNPVDAYTVTGKWTTKTVSVDAVLGENSSNKTFLIVDGSYLKEGTYYVDNIKLYFMEEHTPEEYAWDFETKETRTWAAADRGSEVSYAFGVMSLTGKAKNTDHIEPDKADVFNYLFIKARTEVDGILTFGFTTDRGSGSVVTTVYKDKDYGNLVLPLTGVEHWAGELKEFTLEYTGNIEIEDIRLCKNDGYEDPPGVIEKFGLYASEESITADGGSVTVAPYIRTSDTALDTSVSYTVDSINAVLVKNADGSATVTGKLNGCAAVTAILDADRTKTATVIIDIENQTDKMAVSPVRVLYFGNSIMYHGPNAGIGWTGTWGMAASSVDKDYVHVLLSKLRAKYGNSSVGYSAASITGFEGAITNHASNPEFDYSTAFAPLVKAAKEYKPNVISIQMGENVGTVTKEGYARAVTQLVKALKKETPDAIIVLSTPFWDSEPKREGMTMVAEREGTRLAKLHTLDLPENKAIGKFSHGGVANHPGDLGMSRIAELIYEQINIARTEHEITVYTVKPVSLAIKADTTEITADAGILVLTADLLPAAAPRDIAWSVDKQEIAEISKDGVLTAKRNGTVTVKAVSTYDAAIFDEIEIVISGQTEFFTVTYDKNTTDAVTGMPEADNEAKGEYAVSEAIPERTAYRFVGWSDRAEGGIRSSVTVTADTTLYAIWEMAFVWEFDRAGCKEGFVVENGFNQYVEQDVFRMMATDTDESTGNLLRVISPALALSGADYDTLEMTIKNSEIAENTRLSLIVKTASGDKSYSFDVVNTEYNTYQAKLAGVTGEITGFEFQPTNIDCAVSVDRIEFVKKATMEASGNNIVIHAGRDYENALMIVAYYDGDRRLLKVEFSDTDLSKGENTVSAADLITNSDADKIKVMAFESKTELIPIAKPLQYK